MADYAHRYTNWQHRKSRAEIERVYKQAAKELDKTLKGFLAASARRDAVKRAQLDAGKITPEQYKCWREGQIFQSKQWQKKLEAATNVYVNADDRARALIGDVLKDVFCEAANYTAFDIGKHAAAGVSFDLYDRATVERLLKANPKMLPEWKIDEPKDYTWNEKRVRNAITQGIIQGESIPEIGKRLCGELATSNARKMELFARTAMTGAENAGRVSRMEEAVDMGISVKKRWIATLDSRTRDAHQDLDGEVADVDEPFVNMFGEIMYPGDPEAEDPANVYNCRCTLGYEYPEYKASGKRRAYNDEDSRDSVVIDDMTYEEWKEQKKQAQTYEEWNPDNNPDPDEFDGGDALIERERQENLDNERRIQDLDAEYSRLRRQRRSVLHELSDLEGDNSTTAKERRAELERMLEEIKHRMDVEIPNESSEAHMNQVVFNSAKLVDGAAKIGINYVIPSRNGKPLTEAEIINRIAGGDMTDGSCASVAMCYVAQKEGYDALDFRGGDSREFISQYTWMILRGIAKETGYPLLTEAGRETESAVKLVEQCAPGKEYYLCAGRHAAIVRKTEDGKIQYLELQSATNNGWTNAPVGADGKQDLYGLFGVRFVTDDEGSGIVSMIDVEGMKGSKLLHRTVGYINTEEGKQKKGASGGEK